MRNLVFIAVVVAAIVLLSLYIGRTTEIPESARESLSPQEQGVERMQQIPARVRERVGEAREMHDRRMEEALEGIR